VVVMLGDGSDGLGGLGLVGLGLVGLGLVGLGRSALLGVGGAGSGGGPGVGTRRRVSPKVRSMKLECRILCQYCVTYSAISRWRQQTPSSPTCRSLPVGVAQISEEQLVDAAPPMPGLAGIGDLVRGQ